MQFQRFVPGLYFRVGVRPEGVDPNYCAAPNHSPRQFAYEGCLATGVKLLAGWARDWRAMSR